MALDEKDRVRLLHMLEASRKAIAFTSGKTRKGLEDDEVLALALVRLLEVVGEASRGVSDGLRGQYPEIKWKAIAGTRDRLAHGYFDVDMDIIWQIVSVDLPVLVSGLEKILKMESQ